MTVALTSHVHSHAFPSEVSWQVLIEGSLTPLLFKSQPFKQCELLQLVRHKTVTQVVSTTVLGSIPVRGNIFNEFILL